MNTADERTVDVKRFLIILGVVALLVGVVAVSAMALDDSQSRIVLTSVDDTVGASTTIDEGGSDDAVEPVRSQQRIRLQDGTGEQTQARIQERIQDPGSCDGCSGDGPYGPGYAEAGGQGNGSGAGPGYANGGTGNGVANGNGAGQRAQLHSQDGDCDHDAPQDGTGFRGGSA